MIESEDKLTVIAFPITIFLSLVYQESAYQGTFIVPVLITNVFRLVSMLGFVFVEDTFRRHTSKSLKPERREETAKIIQTVL